MLLVRLLPNAVPRPRTANDEISQQIIEKHYLPFCANTTSFEDNTKVSLLVESLLRLFLVADCHVEHTPGLEAAVMKGIQARQTNIKVDRRKKNNAAKKKEEEIDRLWLEASGERLQSLLTWVETQNPKGSGLSLT